MSKGSEDEAVRAAQSPWFPDGRVDTEGVRWLVCDPYPTWYRQGPKGNLIWRAHHKGSAAPWADEVEGAEPKGAEPKEEVTMTPELELAVLRSLVAHVMARKGIRSWGAKLEDIENAPDTTLTVGEHPPHMVMLTRALTEPERAAKGEQGTLDVKVVEPKPREPGPKTLARAKEGAGV